MSFLLSHHFDDHPLVPLPVKLRVEDALPGPEVQAPGGDWHNHFVMNQQSLKVRVAVGLAGVVVVVILTEWGELLEPLVYIFDQPGFVIVHINAGGDVHGRNQHHAFLNSALLHDGFDLRRDVDVFSVLAGVELEIFRVKFHWRTILRKAHQDRLPDSPRAPALAFAGLKAGEVGVRSGPALE